MSATDEVTELVHAGVHPSELTSVGRNEAIDLIREALRRRSGKTWSVTGGKGTAWGWIRITSPPKRRVAHVPNPAHDPADRWTTESAYLEVEPVGEKEVCGWYMNRDDMAELGALLGQKGPAHCQGVSIAAASDYYRYYIAAAMGLETNTTPERYWD